MSNASSSNENNSSSNESLCNENSSKENSSKKNDSKVNHECATDDDLSTTTSLDMQNDQVANFFSLDHYTMLTILEMVGLHTKLRLRGVCQLWRELINETFAHQSHIFLYQNPHQREYANCNSPEHQPDEDNMLVRVRSFRLLTKHCLDYTLNLTSLSLYHLTFSEYDWERFARLPFIGRTLVHLEVSECEFTQFNPNSARGTWDTWCLQAGASLRHFIMYHNTGWCMPLPRFFTRLKRHFRKLELLVLDIGIFSHRPNLQRDNPQLSNIKTQITHLQLHSYRFESYMFELERAFQLQYIQELTLSCFCPPNGGFVRILNRLENIRVLKIAIDKEPGTTLNVYHSLVRVAQRCENLRELHLLECAETFRLNTTFISEFCMLMRSRLKVLSLANYMLNAEALHDIAQFCDGLEELHIGRPPDCQFLAHRMRFDPPHNQCLDDEQFIEFLELLPNLKTLGYNYAPFFTDEGMSTISRLNLNLRKLLLIGCSRVTPVGMNNFIEFAKSLPQQKFELHLPLDQLQAVINYKNQNIPSNIELMNREYYEEAPLEDVDELIQFWNR